MNTRPAPPQRPEPAERRHRTLEFARGWGLFLREAFTHPRAIGALFPSSPALARRIAGMTGSESGTLVVELGAGTGVVTEALLARGIPPQRLIAIERSPALANLLRERFPEVRVVCGDAAELGTLLQDAGAEARRVNVVSSLPLRSLPPSQVRAILGEIAQVLRAGGHWIQYTYALAQRAVPLGFQRCSSAFVWRNLPPARVDVFACAAFA